MNRKVLYISYDGMTDPLGQSQVIPYLQGLAKHGHEITILSCEKKDRYQQNSILISDLLKKSNIKWNPIFYHKSPPVLSSLWDLFQLYRQARKLIARENCNLLHCRSYIPSLVGLHFSRSRKIPFLFDMRGFWADERVDGKLWNLKHPLYRVIYNFFKRREADFLQESFCTVSLTHAAKKEMANWPSAKGARIEVIPCCADLDFFSEENVNQAAKLKLESELAIPGKIIIYLGSLGTWYMLEEMLDCFQAILEKSKEYYFLFLTPDNPQIVFELAEKKGIPRERLFVRKASRQEVPSYLSLATLGLFFIRPSYSKMSSSPTKLAELLGMGVPVIANAKVGDADQFFQQYQVGTLLSDFSESSYEEAARQIVQIERLTTT